MILSEHDGTEIVSTSFTKYEAETIIDALNCYLSEIANDDVFDNRRYCSEAIRLCLQNQVDKWS